MMVLPPEHTVNPSPGRRRLTIVLFKNRGKMDKQQFDCGLQWSLLVKVGEGGRKGEDSE
jgi:hypothetical protein